MRGEEEKVARVILAGLSREEEKKSVEQISLLAACVIIQRC